MFDNAHATQPETLFLLDQVTGSNAVMQDMPGIVACGRERAKANGTAQYCQ